MNNRTYRQKKALVSVKRLVELKLVVRFLVSNA